MVHLIIATSKKLSTTRASIIQIPYLRMICTINSNQDQQDLLQMIFLIPGQNCMHHLQLWSSSAAPFPLLLGILFTKDTTNEWSLKNQRSHKCRTSAPSATMHEIDTSANPILPIDESCNCKNHTRQSCRARGHGQIKDLTQKIKDCDEIFFLLATSYHSLR